MFATLADGTTKFYPITITDAVVHIKGNTKKKLSEIIDEIDYSGKADKVAMTGTGAATENNFFAIDANGNLKDSGKKAADFDASGAASTAEQNAKDYADGLASNYDAAGAADTAEQNAKDYADGLASNYDAAGTAAGLIEALDASESQDAGADGLALSITEVDGVITGISGSIAANTYDAYGAAADVLGTAQDAASAATVYGAKAYADSLVAGGIIYKGTVDGTTGLPTTGYKKGDYYKVAAAGTYAGHTAQVGDALIANKDYASGATASADWDLLQGSVAVSNDNKDLVIGTEVLVATVEGTQVKVKQVEDTTKIESIACADTTEYADVASVFSAE